MGKENTDNSLESPIGKTEERKFKSKPDLLIEALMAAGLARVLTDAEMEAHREHLSRSMQGVRQETRSKAAQSLLDTGKIVFTPGIRPSR